MQINSSSHFHSYMTPDTQGVKAAVGLEDQEQAESLVPPVKESEKGAASNADANPPSSQSAGNQQTSGNSDQPVAAGEKTSQAQKQQEKKDQEVIRQLKARDLEVKKHEQAHAVVGGQYAGSQSFDYQIGPDGARYAVGGEVSIEMSKVSGDPQATVEKMRVVRAAALAPAEPSPQDRRVAAEASQIAAEAQQEMAMQKVEERQETKESNESGEESDESNTLQSSLDESEKEDDKKVEKEAPRSNAAERFREVYGHKTQESLNSLALGLSHGHPSVGGLLNEIA